MIDKSVSVFGLIYVLTMKESGIFEVGNNLCC